MNNNYVKQNNTQRNSKTKHIIKSNKIPQNKIIDNKTVIINDKNNIPKVQIIKSLQKVNTKGYTFKNIFSQYNKINLNNKIASLDKNNTKASLSKILSQSKEMNNNLKMKHNTNILLGNNNKINNNNSLKLKSKNNMENIRFTQTLTGVDNIPKINKNSNNYKILPKRAIQVVKKPQNKKVKSRNYISIKDMNTINIDSRVHLNDYNPNYYFTTNNKNINILAKSIQTSQNSKKKTKKVIKTDKKNNGIKKVSSIQNSNKKLFNHLNAIKNGGPNFSENLEKIHNKTSLSPSLKNLILKTKVITNYQKNKIINNKNNKHAYVDSYASSDSQRLVKNLKIGISG